MRVTTQIRATRVLARWWRPTARRAVQRRDENYLRALAKSSKSTNVLGGQEIQTDCIVYNKSGRVLSAFRASHQGLVSSDPAALNAEVDQHKIDYSACHEHYCWLQISLKTNNL